VHVTFPHSPVIDSTPTDDDLREWADEALDAFFGVVVRKLDDLYPGSQTFGDIDPLASVQMDRVAREWILSFATNNSAVAAANAED
jgi:hypothetical protein